MTDALHACLFTLALVAPLCGGDSPVQAQTASKALRRSLATPASGRWRDAPLKSAVGRLAEAFSTPLWFDRRVDPDEPITITVERGTLASILDAFASKGSIHATPVDRLIYLGPKESAAALPTLAEQWRRSPPPGMKRRGTTAWQRLATPRAAAQRLVQEAGCRIANPEAVPHDLWPADTTPEMLAGDRLMLLLIGFDLRWVADGNDKQKIRIEPIDYAAMPQSTTTLASLIDGRRSTRAVEQRYTLRVVEQPFEAVMKQLAKQLGRELKLEAEKFEDPGRRISFQVEQASLDQLMKKISEAAGVSIRTTPTEIIVTPEE